MKKYNSNSSMDFEIGGAAVSRGSDRLGHNQFTGYSNDGRLVNKGRGPTRGNDGTCGHAGMATAGTKPPTAAVPGRPSNPDSQRYGTQHRGGGTARPGTRETINMGRGPTRGNQQ